MAITRPEMQNRKTILVYTVQHTGTWFLINLLFTGQNNKSGLLPDFEAKQRGREDPYEIDKNLFSFEDDIYISISECFPIEKVNKDWLNRTFFNFLNEEEASSDLLIIHNHCRQPESELIKNLRITKPEIPIVSSMRDPLLSIFTLIQREHKTYESFSKERTYTRLGRIVAHSNRFLSILTLPKEHVFIFPIDIKEKEKNIDNLFNFCSLEKTEKTFETIKGWKPVNKTETENNLFNDIKSYIISKDIKQIEKYLKVEFDYLRTRKDLKTLLQNLSYEDLSWW